MFQQDYILRQVQAIVESIVRALKLVDEQRYEAAEDALDDSLDGLLRIDRQLFDSLDAASVLPLLGEPERVAAIAQVLAGQAQLRSAQGRPEQASRLRRRALVFLQHARDRGIACEPALQAVREALSQAPEPPA